ncbi:PTS system mannose/fructose/N-acetylgalactosamine-transporter subunit IIB [Lacticaseibacillus jixianensis]|uniref:PTS system mannose/fructose/N-acetylgalactosamine-transporter subunit IIB n=1 Tax=Lacticaseibacillus jixianensis TaxID=2486012 RepID=A0ABW4BDM3_9LACO|nr:PTS sugar transporter subunit IIB [Lacticaseibacillus jixianensis]
MAIIAARIDGRLVHGQVANLWTTKLGASRIIVVDDAAAKSDVEKSGLRMATPESVRLSVLDTQRAAQQLLDHRYDSQKVFLVAKRPETYLALVQAGVPIKELNVGNMSQTDETRSITKSINVVDKDVETFQQLNDLGVHLIAQMVPGDAAADFMPLLKKDRRG